MSTISLDVLAEILSRLPIKSVLCFRCVSTTWCSLIDSPEFAKLHLNHSLKTNTNRMLILRETEFFEFKKHCFYCLYIDGSLSNSRVVTPKVLRKPLKSSDFGTKILGSCNGVLLISNDVDNVALWNPSTGKYKKLPVLSVGGKKEDGDIRFGFGYDGFSDDYKVVKIVQYLGTDVVSGRDSFSSDVNVYSLKSNAWKGVEEEFPYYLHIKEEPGRYLNGALHWVASSKRNTPRDYSQKLIVAFDLATEKCRVVPYPPHTNRSFMVTLEVLEGFLCTCHYYNEERVVVNGVVLDYHLEHNDIWVMKEYGVKDSWTMINSTEVLNDDI